MRTYGIVILALFSILRMGDAYAEAEPEEMSWKPSLSDGGRPIKGYKVRYYSADQPQLMLALKQREEMETLSLDRFQTVPMIGTGDSGNGVALDSLAESRGNMSTGKRVALKLIAGTLGGVMGGVIGASSGDGGQEINFGPALHGYLAGIAIGVPMVDVSGVDPRDRSMLSLITSLGVSLGGSVVGVIGGGGLTLASQDALWPSILIGPVVGATLASEWWRKSSAARRFYMGLGPNPRGILSAVVTLYF